MKCRTNALMLILFSLAILGAAEAQDKQSTIIEIDTKTDETEVQRCVDNPQAMAACRSFIKGFIQGALLTDAAIIKSIEQTEPTFSERALKTRLGSRLTDSPTELAGFCLPEGRSILELAEETLDHVKEAERNSAELAKKVYASLKTDYAC